MIISENQIHMDPVKVTGIVDWPAPTTLKNVRSFLGFCNYYCKFIPGYSQITRPLHDLTKKTQEWIWTTKQEEAFQKLKQLFQQQPVLTIPDPNEPFILATDASKFATVAVLKQKGSDGELHPCGYITESFGPAERNYQIWD